MTCFRLSNGQTLRQWCEENEISYQSVYTHLEKGLSVEEACKKAIKNKGKKNLKTKLFYKGKSVSELFGGSKNYAYKRIMKRFYRSGDLEKEVEKELSKNETIYNKLVCKMPRD